MTDFIGFYMSHAMCISVFTFTECPSLISILFNKIFHWQSINCY